MELRRLIMETKDTKVENLSMEICEIADRILKTWKGKAEDPSAICQFLNYYLPTFRNVLTKYRRMDAGGAYTGLQKRRTVGCGGSGRSGKF